jgi:cell division protein FtsB
MKFSWQQKTMFIFTFILFCIIIYFFSREILRNKKMETEIDNFKDKNEKIVEKIEEIKKEFNYLKTDNFKDKYAKENLNKLNENEKVIIISPEDLEKISSKQEQNKKESSFFKKNTLKEWKDYFLKENFKNKINDRYTLEQP